jgi:hypothetical protein
MRTSPNPRVEEGGGRLDPISVIVTPVPIVLGLAAIAFTLFKRHRRYDLFEDALIVRYLAPRVLAVYMRDIESVQVVRQPTVGPVVSIRRKAGANVIIRPSNPEEMASRLNDALNA